MWIWEQGIFRLAAYIFCGCSKVLWNVVGIEQPQKRSRQAERYHAPFHTVHLRVK